MVSLSLVSPLLIPLSDTTPTPHPPVTAPQQVVSRQPWLIKLHQAHERLFLFVHLRSVCSHFTLGNFSKWVGGARGGVGAL